MQKFGLALSGGGFRASLYHLGLLRFLRDAGLLSQVTHITSVSGGSIMAAHLALNWDRYTGDAKEFDAAASELLDFVRLDVRNRVTRRWLPAWVLRWPARLLGRSNRQLRLTGLLEYHYERYLYGDKSLFELPERPQLHILATNLSEGCLCSFHRNGLLMVRRQPGGAVRLECVHVGLATVAMAVTASSAFPGFFPPLVLTGAEVGASAGEFGRQAYTDGGVFDNLGVRMFHSLERPLLTESPLGRDDFIDFQATVEALAAAGKSPEETPLRRLAQILVLASRQPDQLPALGQTASNGAGLSPAVAAAQPACLALLSAPLGDEVGDAEGILMASLSNVMRHYQFRLDPLFAGLKPADPEAAALLRASRPGGHALGAGDQVWLNRHLIEAAFRQATGRPCFRRLNSGLDGVLVSDVGKPIEVLSGQGAGGLIRTALRATDILMDRVWQLEIETFCDARGFVFAPITDVVEPVDDPTALHPEIQRQVARIRTDLDRFSPLEISTLIRHGYCVGRKACRAHPERFGNDLPGNAPWDPLHLKPGATPEEKPAKAPATATADARALQGSAFRRIWSALLDRRDWVSYVYVPIIVPILLVLPYATVTIYKRTHQYNKLVASFAQGTDDLETLTEMLQRKPETFTGERAEKVRSLEEPDLKGFEILQDSRIIDMRDWLPLTAPNGERDSAVVIRRRMKVLKLRENKKDNLFRLHLLPTSPQTATRFPPQLLRPTLRMCELESSTPGQEKYSWEADFDFRDVPSGDFVELLLDERSPGHYLEGGQGGAEVSFEVMAQTGELVTWIVMPRGREYVNFHITRQQTGKPETSEAFRPVTEYLADDYTIIAFKLVSLAPGWTYQVRWIYK
jgi:predicted acylesterase/phospholipase RssA